MNRLRPLHVGISVSDVKRSATWYADVLGFHVVSQRYQEQLQAVLLFMERDGFQLELFQYNRPKRLPPERLHPDTDLQTIGTKHIAFSTDDLAALLRHCEQKQVDIVFQKEIRGKPMCFLRDPDHILIEIIQSEP